MLSNSPLSLTNQLFSLIEKLLPLIGVLVGALLQSRISKVSQDRDRRHTLKTQAYVDFLRACSEIAISQKSMDRPKEVSALTLLMDAKARIAVYGARSVVEHLARFLRMGAVLDNPKSMNAFGELIKVMRLESLGHGAEVMNDDVIQILFGRGTSNGA